MDRITQLKGISNVNVFGAGQYAMRFWVKPDQLAKLNLTVNDILTALNAQNTVNPAGQVGGPPTPHGQEFTYAITAQGRLVSEKEFGDIVIRENAGRLDRAIEGCRARGTGRNFTTSSAN